MALRTPPSWLQQGSHPAENDRLTTQAIFSTTGIIGSTSMAVTAQGSPNMTVNVAAGWAAIVGTTQSNMGTYVAYNDATTILTITTAPTSNSRIDRVVATVNDAYYSGSTNNVTFTVVAGTVAASPVAPAIPANSISLATIVVGTNVTTITSGNITDTRVLTTTSIVDTSTFVSLNGTQTLTNKTLTGSALSGTTIENAYIAPAFAGPTYNFYATTNGAVQLCYTNNATSNATLNITSTAGQTLDAIMTNGQTVTVTLAILNSFTPYYPNLYRIDGAAPSVIKWANGVVPSGGNASAIDVYTFTITKTASATFWVLASQSRFA